MERAEYERMDAVEDRLWWYGGLRALVLDQVLRFGMGTPGRPWVDAGCGTGGMLARLRSGVPARVWAGLEADPGAATVAAAKSGAAVVVGSVNELPLASASLGGQVSLDVLCHRLVDPRRALAESHRCLERGGILVLNLPAYRWLLSAHDTRVHNARRFRRSEVVAMLVEAGFHVKRATYWNTLLFPLMAARRLLAKGHAESDVSLPPAPVNALFGVVVALERRFLRWGIDLPFGGSVLVVAEKA